MMANSQYMPILQEKLHSEWNSAVRNGRTDFRDRVGFEFTPSRVNEMNPTSHQQTDPSESVESWKIPRYESTRVTQLAESLKTNSISELVSLCVRELSETSKQPMHSFWSLYGEAVVRICDDPLEFARNLDDELNRVKLSRKRLFMHKLFSKLFLLKCTIFSECTSDSKLVSYLSTLSGTDPNLSSLQETYNKLSKLEFHSTGKLLRSGDVMGFMLSELLPYAIRDIPFAILKKIAMLCFDIELFEDDYAKFWDADINKEYLHFRSESSLHKWNDQTMMKGSAQIFDASEPQDSPQDYGVITLAYEAPWIMPNLQQQGGTVRGTSRKSSAAPHPTARMVKMEGRRQSYKPDLSTTSTNMEEVNGAICLVASNEDDAWPETNEFSIRRNSLDEIPGDWDFVGGHGNEKKHGISDVLEDLLGSPTRPSTQTTNSPDNQRSRKRSLSQSPRKHGRDENRSKSPQTVIKKPCNRELNDENAPPTNSQNLREFLWNDEPPISERTRKGGTPKDTRSKYNI